MPTYDFNGTRVRRKNFYMPCIIGPRFDGASDDEQAAILKATYWADNIADSEWPAVLRHDDCSPSAKSRLKKKAAGWLMALQRIARLNPEMFEELVAKADGMYRDQVEDEPPVVLVWDSWLFVSGRPWPVGAPVNWHPGDVADPPQPDEEP
jgi:hypothetical protein